MLNTRPIQLALQGSAVPLRDAHFLWFVGFQLLAAAVMNSSIYWVITPCSMFEVNRRFGGKYSLHLQGLRTTKDRHQHYVLLATFFTLVSVLVYSSTLKMEITHSSETWVHFQPTIRRFNPVDRTLPLISSLSPWSESVSLIWTTLVLSRSNFGVRFSWRYSNGCT
jgi:hypothetical protein